MAITEEKPLIIGQLTVYPNRLKYKDIRCNFFDIEHVGWYWLSKTAVFLNTQDTELSLYVRGREKPIHIKKSTMWRTPKIVTAYKFIAKKTFRSRLSFYISQLEQVGGFSYGNCDIYSDGRVVHNGKIFHLSRADIETFGITIKQGGIFSKKMKIDLRVDRDVILTLIDFILQNPQSPSAYIENHKQQKKTEEKLSHFLRDIVSLMAKLSSADGHVSPEEIKVIKDFLINTIELGKPELSKVISIFNDAKTAPSSFEYFAESLYSRFKNDKNILLGVLDLLFSIAIADGTLSAEEELLLLQAESIFGIKGTAYNNFKSRSRRPTSTQKERYLDVLGLSPDATQEEIHLQYKRLVMKFHPDRVQHLGDNFVKEAEIQIKKINQAYGYLRRRRSNA